MINYKYDFELYTLNELPTNDARLFLNIIVSNALTKAQAIQYKDNTVFVISEEQYLTRIFHEKGKTKSL